MDAQLTEEGAWRRMWGDFPALGRLLGEARVPDHELSWFDHIDRLMRISILVRENAGELRGTDLEARGMLPGGTEPDALARDLHKLASALEHASRQLHAEALEVAQRAREFRP